MIGAYAVDIIRKWNVSTDEFGLNTETESVDINCRVEDYNRLMIDDNGQEVMGEMCIFVETDSVFNFGDKIVIKKKAGIDYEQPNKKFIIKKKIRASGFSDNHWELYV